jgi:ribosome-binding protein aMBF1 (putative translation factor)
MATCAPLDFEGGSIPTIIGFFDIEFPDLLTLPTRRSETAVWVEQTEYVAVGRTLAEARERAGLTQQELARRLRKPQSFVSSYERGQRRVDILELLRIVDMLGSDPLKVVREIVRRAKPSTRRKPSRI